MSETQLNEYDTILQQSDPDIFGWITGKQIIPDELNTDTMNIYSYFIILYYFFDPMKRK